MTRDYRKKLITSGQASPPTLLPPIIKLLTSVYSKLDGKTISVLDVGCGLGTQMGIIKNNIGKYFSTVKGIDWSPATVDIHSNNSDSPYEDVLLCEADRLPYPDKSFDVALSMENLEHLYNDLSIQAIRELARVSKYIVISTPRPQDVINFGFLHDEIREAIMDPEPLNKHDFLCLESAIHKSTLFPRSMAAAGFTVLSKKHGYYFAKSDSIDFEKIRSIGISPENIDGWISTGYKERYIELLAKSLDLHRKIISSNDYDTPSFILRARRWIKAFGNLVFK